MSSDGLSKPSLPLFDVNLSRGLDRLQARSTSFKELPVEKRNEELKKATQEFEALFIGYLLKVMRSTAQSDDTESENLGKETYLEMFDQEIGLHIARSRSLGIGEMLYRRLAEKEGDLSQSHPSNETGTPKMDHSPIIQQVPGRASEEHEPSDSLPSQSGIGDEGSSAQLEHNSLSLPADGKWSSLYGLRIDPLSHRPRFHRGVDMAASTGSPIHAAQEGTVIYSGFLKGYGNTVIIEHENGYRTLYAHAAKNLVAAGEKVQSHQIIGIVGSTGRATGPHLHFELEKGGEKVDPLDYLVSSSKSGSATSL